MERNRGEQSEPPPPDISRGHSSQPHQQRGGRRGWGRGGDRGGGPPPLQRGGNTGPTRQQPLKTWAQAVASSSSRAPDIGPSKVAERVQQLSTEEAQTQGIMQPASSKSVGFPLRPGKGSSGTKCIVKANHFLTELPNKDLHQYDVTITPEVPSREVNRAVMKELVDLYRVSKLGKRLPVYDGRKSMYTTGPLPFVSMEFGILITDEDSKRDREFKVVIKLAAKVDMHPLAIFLQGMRPDAPQEVLQALDIVLRELPTERYYSIGRLFYSPYLGRKRPLGEGLESWRGFYQSVRPTQMGLMLNLDMSSTAFIEDLPVIEYVSKLIQRDARHGQLSDAEHQKVNRELRGVKVEVTHRGDERGKYRISGLTSQITRELKFLVGERGTMKTVAGYFQETYGISLEHTRLPCLQVGNTQRPAYLPMEVCEIVGGQRYRKKLNERQITKLLESACQHPDERERDILKTVHQNAYDEDDYANEFEIKISDEMAQVEARILPPPRLKYDDSGHEKDCLPQVGKWDMRNKRMVKGAKVKCWVCINFSNHLPDDQATGFCNRLVKTCNDVGMDFNREPALPILHCQPDQVERVLRDIYRRLMTKLNILFAILPDKNGSLYGDLKRICETDLGIVSQCFLQKHVLKTSPHYLTNVALKINVKVGGSNTVLYDAFHRRIPMISEIPTIIFGADVTHSRPGEDSSPSIAAVVGSQNWPWISNYAATVSSQAHGQEIIQDFYRMIRSNGGLQPKRIIFYRDGVGEGQFYQVLLQELSAIRRACASLNSNYQPPITFIVVQKRHHTRFFRRNSGDKHTVDKNGNILAGTVVDSGICHPTQFDFYLCSHAGIMGTSRPVHYHVLWDDNRFSADALQILTNNLCYTYARCTRSVSIVPPAYYAHLAAYRARFYIAAEPEAAEPDQNTSRAFTPLPPLHENVKKFMFYC